MKKPLLLALVLAFSALTQSPASALPAELTGPARVQALTLASTALNQSKAVKGRFTQIAPDGRASQGAFYLQRPGKLRFEYDPPATLTIITDGALLSVADRAMKTDERYPLRTTPLYFVLKRDVNLETDGKVTRVAREGDAIYVTVRDRTGKADGSITLIFDAPSKELRAWRVVDGQGQLTQVVLAQTQSVATLDPALFKLKPAPSPPGSHR